MLRSILVATALCAVPATLATTSSATRATTAPPARAGDPCMDLTRCHVVGHADVDGDGTRDAVAFQRLSRASLVVRVLTGSGDALSARVHVAPGPQRGEWGGATTLDSAHGDELVILTALHPKTPGYTVLTDRDGVLQTEPSPYGERRWHIENTTAACIGWREFETDVDGKRLVGTVVERSGHGDYVGTRRTFAYHHGTWQETSHRHLHLDPAQAARMSGFHVMGLDPWPALGS